MAHLTEDRRGGYVDSPVALALQRDRLQPMTQLPADQRQLLWDHYVTGMTFPELAEEQQQPASTLRGAVMRARRDLRRDIMALEEPEDA